MFTFFVVQSAVAEEAPRYWDFNNDGKEDLWYEDSEFSYLEHLDRNYDGTADQRTQYDSRTDWPLYGVDDNDFDGTFETRHVFKNGTIQATLVDSNQDECFDIIHYYLHDLVFESKRFEATERGNLVTTIKYKYQFPIATKSQDTTQSACDFHKQTISDLPSSHEMPKQSSN